ncbi:hypothetical protein ACFWTC_32080 [Streptomyces sp. NPDC058619]|uniref:hypothetical protein n=1 Tax=unclassified Streptomyces TaxID=2593676 RepID=UPI003658E3AE
MSFRFIDIVGRRVLHVLDAEGSHPGDRAERIPLADSSIYGDPAHGQRVRAPGRDHG